MRRSLLRASTAAWIVGFVGMVIAAAFVHPGIARADANAEARAFFDEGNRHLALGLAARAGRRQSELEAALAAYVSSLRVVRTRNAVYNAGLALEGLGRFDEAYEYVSEYLAVADLSAEDRAEATSKLATLRARVCVLEVTSVPAGATVHIDRRDLAARGVTPLVLALAPGTHRVHVSLAGYDDVERRVEAAAAASARVAETLIARPVALRVVAGAGVRIEIDRTPVDVASPGTTTPGRHRVTVSWPSGRSRTSDVDVPAGTAPFVIEAGDEPRQAPAHVVVTSNVPARVTLGGHALGIGEHVRAEVPEGPNELVVEAQGRRAYRTRIRPQAGETIQLSVTLTSTASRSRFGAWKWVALVVSGLFATTTAIATADALTAHDAWTTALAQNRRGVLSRSEAEGAANRLDQANRNADTTLALTLAAGAVTTLLWLFDDIAPEESRATVAVAPMREGAVLVASIPLGVP